MKVLIKKLLREGLKSLSEENLKDFYNRFKQTNFNSNFIEQHFKNPNFELRLVSEGGVKFVNFDEGERNKCETNSFKFIKSMVKLNDHRYYPVSGWAFMESTTYFEHFWVYDAVNNMFMDISPLIGDKPYAYGGVINKNINDEIMNAEKVFDVSFFKSKGMSTLFASCEANTSNPKLDSYKVSNDSYESKLFNYIANTAKYSNLNNLIKKENISNLEQLKSLLPELENNMDNARSNRDFDLFNELITQINILYKNIYK